MLHGLSLISSNRQRVLFRDGAKSFPHGTGDSNRHLHRLLDFSSPCCSTIEIVCRHCRSNTGNYAFQRDSRSGDLLVAVH